MASNSSGSGYETPKPTGAIEKKRKYSQKYNKSWENDEEFKRWLRGSRKGSSFAFCCVCYVDLNLKAGKSDLRKHAGTKKHQENCSAINQQPSLFSFASHNKKKESEMVKASELHIAAVITEHDLPFTVAEHMPKFIQAVCPDSEVAKNLKCGRTKATAIVKNVSGQESFEQLIETLQKRKFSLIVDESTDKGCIKHLCLVSRTIVDSDVKDCFLGLIPVQDGSASTLHANIVNFFESNKIPYKDNMIGFGADGANTMFGARHSLATLFKEEIPSLFTMKCICHSFALCASYACLKLPRGIEDLARDIYSYFSNSPKRLGELQQFQAFVKPHKLLHPSQTRWLSLQMVVTRLLEQYSALVLYFTDAVLSERLLVCENTLQKLCDPTTKLFLQFLDFILPSFNGLNKQMQSETSQIHTIRKSVISSYTTLLECYLKDEYVEKCPLHELRPSDPHNFKDLKSMYFGAAVEMTLSQPHSIPPQAVEQFKLRCLDFYIEGALQISKRFPLGDKVFQQLEVLDPKVVKAKSVPSLGPLMNGFPLLVNNETLQKIDSEWRMLRNAVSTFLTDNPDITPIKFWVKVSVMTAGDGTQLFPNLAEFMMSLLSLPHSSAAAERVFSAINRMKTKTRNRLSTNTIVGLLHTKRLMTDSTCYDVEITDSLTKRMTSSMYVTADSDEDM